LALANELIFATGPDGGLFRVFSSGISAYMNQNHDEHTFTTQHTGGVGYDRLRHSTAQVVLPLFGRISKDLKYKTSVSNHL